MRIVEPTWNARSGDAGRLMRAKTTAATAQPRASSAAHTAGWRRTAARSASVGARSSRSQPVAAENDRLPHTTPAMPARSM